jgi:hypothetical protein
MTTDKGVSTDWQGAINDLRDKPATATGWSIAEDPTNTGDVTKGDYFVLEANSGEYIRIDNDPNTEGDPEITVEYGPDYDTTGSSWNDRYQNDPTRAGKFATKDKATFAISDSNGGPINLSDTCTYWMTYDQSGFVMVVQRTEGDGNDAVMCLGFVEVSKLFNYSTAAVREAEMAFIYYGGVNGGYEDNNYPGWSENNGDGRHEIHDGAFMCAGGDSPSHPARGRPNGDSNFGNYPIIEKYACLSAQYGDTLIGHHTRLFEPDAATHGDTVEDSGGTELYAIIDKGGTNNVPPLGLRSDV